jgi:hypothetical protein
MTAPEIQYFPYRTVRAGCVILFLLWGGMSRRLDDRIKDLCAKAVATSASPELEEILQELRTALREHNQRLRKVAAYYPMRPDRPSIDQG